LAERVGFELSRLQWILQLTDSKIPPLPSMPAMPWRIARYCPVPERAKICLQPIVCPS